MSPGGTAFHTATDFSGLERKRSSRHASLLSGHDLARFSRAELRHLMEASRHLNFKALRAEISLELTSSCVLQILRIGCTQNFW